MPAPVGYYALGIVEQGDNPDELPWEVDKEPILYFAFCTEAPGDPYAVGVMYPVTLYEGPIDRRITILEPSGRIITPSDDIFYREYDWLKHVRGLARKRQAAKKGAA